MQNRGSILRVSVHADTLAAQEIEGSGKSGSSVFSPADYLQLSEGDAVRIKGIGKCSQRSRVYRRKGLSVSADVG
jgi:hypothetical protein